MPLLRMPKAQPTGEKPVPGLVVTFTEEIPEFPCGTSLGLDAARSWYRYQAQRFVDTAEHSAPGGFMDALLAVLCARKASVLVVPGVVEPVKFEREWFTGRVPTYVRNWERAWDRASPGRQQVETSRGGEPAPTPGAEAAAGYPFGEGPYLSPFEIAGWTWGQSPIAQALGEEAGEELPPFGDRLRSVVAAAQGAPPAPDLYAHAGAPHACIYCEMAVKDQETMARCEPSIDFLLERSERMSRDARVWQSQNPKVAQLKAADAALVAARAAARMEAGS